MIVHVRNQEQMIALAPVAGTVIISITNPAQAAAIQEGWDAVLRLKFLSGTTPPEPEPPREGFPDFDPKPLTVFNTEIATEIGMFCLMNQNKDFVVHCAAGLHRSIAVASFIRDVFGAEMVRHVPDDGWDWENDSMYQMLMEHCRGINPC